MKRVVFVVIVVFSDSIHFSDVHFSFWSLKSTETFPYGSHSTLFGREEILLSSLGCTKGRLQLNFNLTARCTDRYTRPKTLIENIAALRRSNVCKAPELQTPGDIRFMGDSTSCPETLPRSRFCGNMYCGVSEPAIRISSRKSCFC